MAHNQFFAICKNKCFVDITPENVEFELGSEVRDVTYTAKYFPDKKMVFFNYVGILDHKITGAAFQLFKVTNAKYRPKQNVGFPVIIGAKTNLLYHNLGFMFVSLSETANPDEGVVSVYANGYWFTN